MDKKVIPIKLRHSNLDTLHTCKRKFQIEELMENSYARSDTVDTVFGTAYGVGIAVYFVTQDQDKALFEAWLAYKPELESEKKNIPRMLCALMASFPVIDTLLMEYEVAYFKGAPAIELSFRLDAGNYYFVGHIDLVLRHRITGVHFILDAKTTALQLLDLSPLYKHSGQALGYSIALDRIVGKELTNYGVLYMVAQLPSKEFRPKIQVMTFEKTLLDRLNWFLALGLNIKQLDMMEELNFYPMEYQGCLRFNRACPHFGVCDLHSFDAPRKQTKDTEEYHFTYELNELITNHLKRIKEQK
jgi:hypothetical protein